MGDRAGSGAMLLSTAVVLVAVSRTCVMIMTVGHERDNQRAFHSRRNSSSSRLLNKKRIRKQKTPKRQNPRIKYRNAFRWPPVTHFTRWQMLSSITLF
ncbi:hypothetical protein G7K_5023-t1 [Saitoella complicata NRRL Y-17804]|uniref:Secreted protein n=1 Tax=Saitoella complicata (strain BCRC 22490 / CBS 7301 / JCM 7358 / NBRC 10748 / NRRL Y-17804) TaxID=698492 RepID=A0A0E9NM45_SAICN|nr:hypothetical protein G7K_5023-t1 [Saitoella complicata NRRL Y-17804]